MPKDKQTTADFRDARCLNNVSIAQLSEAMADNPKFSMGRLEERLAVRHNKGND